MRATQQILDINSAIKLGYLRYIYMEELCRNLEVYYDEDNEYRPFFIGACGGVRQTLRNIKKIILAKDKEEDKKKEKIILEEKKKHETKGNLETILEDEHENKKGKAVLVEDEHENKNNEENILEEENEGEHVKNEENTLKEDEDGAEIKQVIFENNIKFASASPLESREYSHHAHPPAYNWDLNKIKSWNKNDGPGYLEQP
uniref:Uncharacterized protein n=1 Tax=Meloidogyne javanica TaxID=6303 RepID=A0A915M154_MELJA